VVIASSRPIPAADVDRANPPHKKAADRYKDYFDRFICTMEWPSAEDPSPVVLGIDANGAQIVEDEIVESSAKSAEAAKAAGRKLGRLSEVAAAATAAGRYAGGVVAVSETAAMTGSERVQAAIKADRGSDAAPTTAVGFGRGC
jgi:hypothetical protein